MEAPFSVFTGGRPERWDSWSWGPSYWEKKKVEIIEAELQKLERCGLDGAQVFHTLYNHWVALLAERVRLMWKYGVPSDPDRVSPEELPNDEVWSHLDRVLQLRAKETLDGKLGPLHAAKLSKLVCSPLLCVLFPFCSRVS